MARVRTWGVVLLANAVALVVGLAVASLIVALYGKPVGEALGALWDGAFGGPFPLGNTLNKSAALLFVALGFIIARKAGLVNLGGEGQLYVGGMVAVAVGLALVDLGGPIAVTGAVLGGFLGGAAWGGLAGWLHARLRINEVIATFLLYFIGRNLASWAVQDPNLLREPVTTTASEPQSRLLPGGVRLGLLFEPPSRAHVGVVLAVVAAVAVAFLLSRTVLGFRLRMLGHNPAMAARTGVSTSRLTILAMAISGGLCGLSGTSVLLGEQYRLRPEFSPGYGFDGIAVALLARESPVGAIAASVLFGALRAAGNQLEARVQVPQALVLVVQGTIVLSIAASDYWVRRQRRKVAPVAGDRPSADGASPAGPPSASQPTPPLAEVPS